MDTRIDIVSAVKRVLDAKNGVFLRRMKQPIEAVSLCEEHADLTAFSLADKIKGTNRMPTPGQLSKIRRYDWSEVSSVGGTFRMGNCG